MRGAVTVLGVLALLVTAPRASAQSAEPRIVVTEFSGPANRRMRRATVRGLGRRSLPLTLVPRAELEGANVDEPSAARAEATRLEVHGFLTGESRREGRRHYLTWILRSGATGEITARAELSAGSRRQLERRARGRAWRELQDAVAALPAPRAEPEPEPEPVVVPEPVIEAEPAPEPMDTPAVRGAAAAPIVRVSLGGQVSHRRITYNDEVTGTLPGYRIAAPAVVGELAVFPAARSEGLARHFGAVVRYEHVVLADSRSSVGNGTFGVSSYRLEADAAFRSALGPVELSATLGYGRHQFGHDDSGAQLEVPNVRYQYGRAALGFAWHSRRGVRLSVEGAVMYLFDVGSLDDEFWFPRISGGGMDAGFGLRVPLAGPVAVAYGFQLRRYFFSVNPEVGDPRVAGGMLDRFITQSLRLEVSID